MTTKDIDDVGFGALARAGTAERPQANVGENERLVSGMAGAGLLVLGISRKSLPGALLAALGGYLVYRGGTGRCALYQRLGLNTRVEGGARHTLESSITVLRPREEVFQFWRRPESFPRFMRRVERVEKVDGETSRWVVRLPGGVSLRWNAEIVESREPELIRWRSVEGSELQHHGSIRLTDAPGGRGTEVKVRWTYQPPGQGAGAVAARLVESLEEAVLHEELRRFKQIIETGELATIEGQTSGRIPARGGRARRVEVTEGRADEGREPRLGERAGSPREEGAVR